MKIVTQSEELVSSITLLRYYLEKKTTANTGRNKASPKFGRNSHLDTAERTMNFPLEIEINIICHKSRI
jgi:hypothetical protein